MAAGCFVSAHAQDKHSASALNDFKTVYACARARTRKAFWDIYEIVNERIAQYHFGFGQGFFQMPYYRIFLLFIIINVQINA